MRTSVFLVFSARSINKTFYDRWDTVEPVLLNSLICTATRISLEHSPSCCCRCCDKEQSQHGPCFREQSAIMFHQNNIYIVLFAENLKISTIHKEARRRFSVCYREPPPQRKKCVPLSSVSQSDKELSSFGLFIAWQVTDVNNLLFLPFFWLSGFVSERASCET